jgi:hypothetical protein
LLACQAVARGVPRPAFAQVGFGVAAFSRVPRAKAGGVDRDRTDDLKLAKLALSQLSYDPVLGKSAVSSEGWPANRSCGRFARLRRTGFGAATSTASQRRLVGPGGVEPPTSRLSGVRSNHLSYEPYSVRTTPKAQTPKERSPKHRRKRANPQVPSSISDVCSGKGDVDGGEAMP